MSVCSGACKNRHPYRGSAIGTSNSLDETATPFPILDQGVDFGHPKSRISKCLQRSLYFCRKVTNVLTKDCFSLEFMIFKYRVYISPYRLLVLKLRPFGIIMPSDRAQIFSQIAPNASPNTPKIACDSFIEYGHLAPSMTRKKLHKRFLGRPSCYLSDFRKVLLASPWISERNQEWIIISAKIFISIRRNYWPHVFSLLA